jgi:Fe2+ or Zn2+ uptake regulation protein
VRAAPQTRRSSGREQILVLIRQHPDGLMRKDILERMGLKGNKSGEMSVSNALTALTKSNQVVRAEGRYRESPMFSPIWLSAVS